MRIIVVDRSRGIGPNLSFFFTPTVQVRNQLPVQYNQSSYKYPSKRPRLQFPHLDFIIDGQLT